MLVAEHPNSPFFAVPLLPFFGFGWRTLRDWRERRVFLSSPSSFDFGGREVRGTIVYPLHVKEVEKGRASHLFSVEVLLVALQRALGRNMVHHLVRDVSKVIGCCVQVGGFGRKRGGG